MTRFLTLDDVAEELAISRSQAYALVRNGTLPAMKVGGVDSGGSSEPAGAVD